MTKLGLENVTAQYPHLDSPHSFNEGQPKYTILIKMDKFANKKEIIKLQAAINTEIDKLCAANPLLDRISIKSPVKDEDEQYISISASSYQRPLIKNTDGTTTYIPNLIHSGDIVSTGIDIKPYSFEGKYGITCHLAVVKKIKNGNLAIQQINCEDYFPEETSISTRPEIGSIDSSVYTRPSFLD